MSKRDWLGEDAITVDIGAALYQATLRCEGGRIIYERNLTVSAITFTAKQYATAKAFFDRVHEADRTLIAFRQK